MIKYNSQKIEKKWRKVWEKEEIYKIKDSVKGKKNFITLVEFPYPSGNLHIGHWYAFAIPDIFARFNRMNGKNVMYPIGFDAFGLPAENAAIKRKINPRDWTEQNIKYMTNQLKSMGASFDWDRKVSTIDPEYYKWTQWIFLKMYEKGLAYRAKTSVNWCPNDMTVLANEQVVNGKCERCGAEVAQKEIEQWMFKITDYADRLIDDMENLDWPNTTKLAQKNWIGRSEGALVKFPLVIASEAKQNQKSQIRSFAEAQDDRGGSHSERSEAISETAEQIAASQAPRNDALATTAETFGFTPSLIPLVLSGEKYISYRLIPKNVKVGDVMEFLNSETKKRYTLAKITKIEVKKAKELSEKEPGHEKFKTRKEFYATYNKYYNTKVTDNTDIWLYYFELVPEHIEVFTTRVDTIFGCTYIVVAPEHSLAKNYESGIKNYEEVKKYIEESKKKTDLMRTDLAKDKTGVELKGIKAINPFNGQEVPVFVADYVLGGYGTGAVMAVPAHDERDFEFAMRYNLEIKKVITPRNYAEMNAELRGNIQKPFTDDGTLIDSEKFTGLTSEKAREEMIKWLEEKGLGGKKKNFKLHDWVLSRQRYWGVPIPMVKCVKCASTGSAYNGYVPVPEKDLPVKLPKLDSFLPSSDGRSPLAKAKTWTKVKCPVCKGIAERETDTMDTFVDSSWYFIRYADPKNKKKFADIKKMKKWLPVPMYIGGAEHNTMHLLYSRFFTKALYDLKLVPFKEPFIGRRNHGVILGPDNQKMSKSKGNVVDPDKEVEKFGADAVRMYLAFMGPYEQGGPWQLGGILGIKRFLERVWQLSQNYKSPNPLLKRGQGRSELEKVLHQTIKKVGEDIEAMRFNTAISSLMILLNKIEENKDKFDKEVMNQFLIILCPFAPFLTEEIWQNLRGTTQNKRGKARKFKSIHLEKWPKYNAKLIVENKFQLVVQINGKFRDTVQADKGIGEKKATEIALGLSKIKELIAGKNIRKIIYVDDRLINIVI